MESINTQVGNRLHMSERIGELAGALSKAQSCMSKAKMDSINPFFHSNYANLAAIWDVCRESLSANGLAITQVTSVEGERVVLTTVLLHNSGQWLSGDYPLSPVKSDPQSMGSAVTYARRYALSAILGIVADEDDDGEATMKRGTQQRTSPKATTPKTEPEKTDKAEDKISEAQRKKIFATADQMGYKDDDAKALMKKKFGVEHTKDLSKKQASDLITAIEAGETVNPKAAEDNPE